MLGYVTRDAADKATHFIEVANTFGLPLISLIDNPGVMPGPAAEESAVLKAAAGMAFDKVIDPRDLRNAVIDALGVAGDCPP